jgi:hypothetical protein
MKAYISDLYVLHLFKDIQTQLSILFLFYVLYYILAYIQYNAGGGFPLT